MPVIMGQEMIAVGEGLSYPHSSYLGFASISFKTLQQIGFERVKKSLGNPGQMHYGIVGKREQNFASQEHRAWGI